MLALLYVAQLGYYASVGWGTGMWDLYFTRAEKDHAFSSPANYAQALADLQTSLRYAQGLSEPDGRLARTYHDLATLEWLHGQWPFARKHFGEARLIFARTDGPQSLFVGVIDARLGEMDLDEGRLEDAERRLTGADEILLRVTSAHDSLLLRTLVNLVRLRDRQGRKREAFVLGRPLVAEVVPNVSVGDLGYRTRFARLIEELRAQQPNAGYPPPPSRNSSPGR